MLFLKRSIPLYLLQAWVLFQCGSLEAVRVEPQLGPWRPQKVLFHPSNPFEVLIVEDDGLISVWNMEDTNQPERRLTIYTNAADAVYTPEGEIITAGLDGLQRRWDREGRKIWQSKVSHDGLPASIALGQGGAGKKPVLASGSNDGTVRLWNYDGSPRGEPLTGHNNWVRAVVFSPDGQTLASAGDDGTVRLWNLDGSPRGEPLTGHNDWVRAVAFSPDGQTLASAGDDGTVRLWNLDGSPRGEPLKEHDGSVRTVAFSQNGQLFATGGEDGTVRLWNLDGSPHGAPLAEHERNRFGDGDVLSVAFAPGEEILASVGKDGTVRLWNLDGSPHGEPITGHEGKAIAVTVSPNAELMASAGADGTVKLWDLNGNIQGSPIEGHEGVIADLAFSSDGRLLASAGFDGTVRLWNLNGSPYGKPLVHRSELLAVAFSPSEDILATADKSGAISLWRFDGSRYGKLLIGHQDAVVSLVFDPKGELLVSAGGDGVRLWDAIDFVELKHLKDHDGPVPSVAFSPKGDIFASAGFDGAVRLWQKNGDPYGDPIMGHKARLTSVAFSPHEDVIASAGDDGAVHLWNLDGSAHGEPLRTEIDDLREVSFARFDEILAVVGFGVKDLQLWSLDGSPRGLPLENSTSYDGLTTSIDFSPKANRFASGHSEGDIRLWRFDGSILDEPISGHEWVFSSLAFAPDGQTFATVDFAGSVRLWNLNGTSLSRELQPSLRSGFEATGFETITFSHGGSFLAVSGYDGIRLWNLGQATYQEPLVIGEDPVSSVAFAPDDATLVAGAEDGTVHLWGLDGSTKGKILTAHDGAVTAVAFAPSGDVFASGGMDGAVRLWSLDGTLAREFLGSSRGYIRSIAFSPEGDILATASSEEPINVWNLAPSSSNRPPRNLGLKVSILDFFEDRLFALHPSGRLTIFSNSWQPKAHFFLTSDGVLAFTNGGWFSGSPHLLGQVRHFPGADQPALDITEAFVRYYSPAEVIATSRGRTFWETIRAELVSSAQTAKKWHTQLHWWQKFGLWPTVFYLSLILGFILTWILRPAALAHRAMPSFTEPKLPPWKWAIQTASLVQWLGGTQRALDAWLRHHDGEFYSRLFADRESVRDRERYVELDHADGVDTWQNKASAGRSAVAWISGPGGSGKSTLAFRMARTHSESANRRPVLPIVVEEDWQGSLLTHLAKRLHVEDRRPTERMVQKLAHTGRLVVVVDGLSERRNKGAENELVDLTRQGTFRHLLVTTRSPDPPKEEFHHLKVGPLELEKLPSFVRAYVDDADPEPIENALRHFSRGEPLRPLFARLAIEQYRDTGQVPETVPELVLQYVQTLHRPESGMLIHSDFLRATRVAAKACVLDELAPRTIAEDELRGHLKAQDVPFRTGDGDELAGSRVLDELVSAGLLESSAEPGRGRVRFANEPVAEYLVALAVAWEGDQAARELQMKIDETGGAACGLAEALKNVLEAETTLL